MPRLAIITLSIYAIGVVVSLIVAGIRERDCGRSFEIMDGDTWGFFFIAIFWPFVLCVLLSSWFSAVLLNFGMWLGSEIPATMERLRKRKEESRKTTQERTSPNA